jgi:hypothetical protein
MSIFSHILLAMYNEAAACMRHNMRPVSQLSSAQLIPLHHFAHLHYPACLIFYISNCIRLFVHISLLLSAAVVPAAASNPKSTV